MTERYGYDKTPTPPIDYDVSKVPPEIKKRTTWVKTKYTGEDVAEAYGQVGDIAGIYAGEAKQLAERTQIRQDAVEDFNNQVIQEMTDKDIISAPEIIEARKGRPTLADRLERDALKTSRILVVDTFLSIGDSDDSLAIQAAIDAANDGDTVMFLPRTYHANFAQIEAKNDIVLDGNACSIIYNGEYIMADEIKARLFSVRNSKRIMLKNMKLYGKMFDGLNKESMPTDPIENNIFTTLHHTAILGAYSEDVKVDNVIFEDFCQSLELDYVDGFELKDLKSKDNRAGYRLYRSSRGRILNVDSQDARYTLDHIPSGTDEPLVTSIGASGSGMLIDECEDIIVEKSSVQRAGTNSFRVQGGSKAIVIRDCWTDQGRRHGFSVYGEDNDVVFENIEDKRLADPEFWNGTDYYDTFKRPHEITSPVGISISDINGGLPNKVEIINSKVTAIKQTTMPVTNNPGGVFRAIAPRRLIYVSKNNRVKVKGLILRGYSTTYPSEFLCDNSDIQDVDIEGNMLPGESVKYNIRGETKGTNFINIRSKDGMGPAFFGEKNVIKDVLSTDADYHGIVLLGDDFYVDGCIVTNSNGRETDGVGIQVYDGNGIVFGTNIVRDTRETPKILRAFAINPTVTEFDPGKMISQGVTNPLYNDNGTNNFVRPLYGKALSTDPSTASDVNGLKNDLNTLIQRLKNANLMS